MKCPDCQKELKCIEFRRDFVDRYRCGSEVPLETVIAEITKIFVCVPCFIRIEKRKIETFKRI